MHGTPDCASAASAARTLRDLGLRLPELAPYRAEAPRMDGAAGAQGYLRLEFEREPAAGRTLLSDMDRRAPLLAQKALYWDASQPDMACVTIISSAGCVVQGDRLALTVRVGPGARALVCTQSATRVHGMEQDYASQLQILRVEENGYLEYMPDPLILHRTARYLMDTHIVLPASATLLYGEVLLPGRKYHHPDELFGFHLFSSSITARREMDGDPLFAEHFVLEPGRMNFGKVGVMGPFEVFGHVLALTPARHLDALREGAGAALGPDLAWGATILPHEAGLLFKVLGPSTESVRAKIREFHAALRRVVLGTELPEDFLWR
ncbi:MAG: urease accessory protein UreD [Desulfovibrionaceae bacterium]|nr:urease accessory protein UreD [Desulfovibrionaceae bacterium]